MASKTPIKPTESGLGLDNSYDHETDPSLEFSNARVKEAREAVANGTDRVYRIYTDGIFDLFHIGHMQMLKQAKYALGNPKNVELIAGVCTDADTKKYKGKNVMDQDIRTESVKHCKWVDEVVEGPWFLSEEFLTKHRIDFVAHDAIPYTSAGCEDVYSYVKSQGKFLATQRTNGISTTDLIVQIVRDYDDHVVRNLKRGVDKKALNLGRTWAIRAVAHEKELKFKDTLEDLKSEQKQVLNSLKKLTMCLNNNNAILQKQNQQNKQIQQQNQNLTKSQNVQNDEQNLCTEDEVTTTPDRNLCTELTDVAKHSYNLCIALGNTGCAALGYFNIFSYISMYQQTNGKKD
jgi:cytidyltransferase-like protein